MSEIRYDRIHNQYVLIAPERLRRPDTLKQNRCNTQNKEQRCPFCEGNESLTPPEISAIRNTPANEKGWQTRVVPNLYKALRVELEQGSKNEGGFESAAGVGAHEVLIDSPCHDCGIEALGVAGLENWLQTIFMRAEDLQKDRRLVYLSIFKNHGEGAGATQEHPHTQILALPLMPKNELDFLKRNMEYYHKHGRGELQDALENELLAQKRLVGQSGVFVAFCPFASAYPFEVMIVPRVNMSSILECSRDDLTHLALLFENVFLKMKSQLGEFDYNLSFSMSPLNENFENEEYMPRIGENYRFMIRILPRLYRLGGFEVSTGMAINPVSPEQSASLLKAGDVR